MKTTLFFILTLLIVLTGMTNICEAQVKNGSFNFTLKVLLSKKTPAVNIPEATSAFEKYIFLDAREYNEYTVSHIKNARFIGDKTFELSAIRDLPKNTPLIIYCSIGKRSEDITLKMKKAGYTNVKNLYGGIFEWVNEGHPVYNIQNKPTDSVHAYSKFWGKFLDKGIKVY